MKTCLFYFVFCLLSAGGCLGLTVRELYGPAGSGEFGRHLLVLKNGNFVVTDPLYDRAGGITDAGAVYLFRPDGTLINRIQGSTIGDKVGSGGLTSLDSGNFVVRSPDWDNGGTVDAGAVTFGHAETGFDVGALSNVTSSNSLVGGNTNDSVGSDYVAALTNGHYLVLSPGWNGTRGAVTWGNGFYGTTGVVNSSNSVVGSTVGDQVELISYLDGGACAVGSYLWDNGGVVDAGAVRVCRGDGPTTGAITAANALVGSTAGDNVGSRGASNVGEGNYVVLSPKWRNGGTLDAGAATWVSGSTGLTGPVTTANSLVGTSTGDAIGSVFVLLSNGHYFVSSGSWDNGATADVGALTWCNGFMATVGSVSPTNSWIGSSANDAVGTYQGFEVGDGHFVFRNPFWDLGGIADVGAVTWISDVSGPSSGVVSPSNSLHGTTAGDLVSRFGTTERVANGAHYIVTSNYWNNGAVADAGAVTWCDGNTGRTGPVSADNSLVGTTANDQVGVRATILSNGNYVINASSWDNGSVVDAGAVTWGNGKKGIKGPVSAANSLVGMNANDEVGENVQAVSTHADHYAVLSPTWHSDPLTSVGAVTWVDGSKAVKGTISAANSLIGSQNGDAVGNYLVAFDPAGNYIVKSPFWNGNRGAVTWGSSKTGVKGVVSASNSLVGAAAGDKQGSGSAYFLDSGDYFVASTLYQPNGALTLCRRDGHTVGVPDASNSIFGGTTSIFGSGASISVQTVKGQCLLGNPAENKVYLLGAYFPTSLSKTSYPAPGATDIAFSTIGMASVNNNGGVMFDQKLTGAGAKSGKNHALFSTAPESTYPDLVMQNGDAVFVGYYVVQPTVSALGIPLNNQQGRGLFQVTLKGGGLTSSNNRMLMFDSGVYVESIFRTGVPMPVLNAAKLSSFKELLQADEADLISLNYTLASGGTPAVNSGNDSGILPLNHGGVVINDSAREGTPAFGGGGTMGQFNTKGAVGYEVMHFSATFKPTAGTSAEALFRMDSNGDNAVRVALVGDAPPDITGDPDVATVKYSSFTGVSQQVGGLSENTLFKAMLKNGDSARNEGLWMLPHSDVPGDQRIIRKGDQITGLPGGVVLSSIQRFWPADQDQVMILGKISGPGVNDNNNMVLLLRQEDGSQLVLMRTGETKAGLGNAKVKTISAVEVVSGSGTYAVLTTLSDAPSNSNQALWTGCTTFGAPTPADQAALRQPVVRLQKGDRYSSSQTDSAVIKSISMKPFPDTTGAGNRGLGRCQSFNGKVAVYLLIDRNVTELVLLPALLTPT
ncbi:MAG: hypothetical protein JNJ83_23515 [Verrucomicrobiaceae bacterium]|nr:hypothetical protein [Verrucomicrobiaceae bacterium]